MSLESIFGWVRPENIKTPYTFHFGEILALRNPITKILDELKGEINAGTYKLLLGDDASGRIPANVFGRVLKSIYKEKKFKNPKIRFLPANPQMPQTALNEQMKKMKSDASLERADKILIVTDTISSGGHLGPLVKSLKEQNISFDIAAIGVIGGLDAAKHFQNEWGCKVVLGEEHAPNIYGKRELAGVWKQYGDSVSRSQKKAMEVYGQNRVIEAQNKINLAREDVEHLSEELIKWYTAAKNNV